MAEEQSDARARDVEIAQGGASGCTPLTIALTYGAGRGSAPSHCRDDPLAAIGELGSREGRDSLSAGMRLVDPVEASAAISVLIPRWPGTRAGVSFQHRH